MKLRVGLKQWCSPLRLEAGKNAISAKDTMSTLELDIGHKE